MISIIPIIVVIAFVFVVVFAFVLRRTRFGQHTYAIGGSVDAAVRAGHQRAAAPDLGLHHLLVLRLAVRESCTC